MRAWVRKHPLSSVLTPRYLHHHHHHHSIPSSYLLVFLYTEFIAKMATFTERFTKGTYPIHSVAESVAPGPKGVDLYSRFFLAGALCW